MHGISNVESQRIQTIASIPVPFRLRDREFLLVALNVGLIAQLMSSRSPITRVVFIMSIEGTYVEN